MAPRYHVPGLNRGIGMKSGGGFLLGKAPGTGRGPIQVLSPRDLSQLGLQSVKSAKGAGQAIATSTSASAASTSISAISATLSSVITPSLSSGLSTAESYALSVALSTTNSLSTGVSTSLSTGVSSTSSLSTALASSISSTASTALSSTTSLSTGVSTSLSTDLSKINSLSTAVSTVLSSSISSTASTALSSTTSLSTSVSTSLSTNLSSITSLSTALSTSFTNAIGGNVALNNTANFIDGPSVAQGTSGLWFVSGTVTVFDSSVGPNTIQAVLWDGTTTIAAAECQTNAAISQYTMSLSGIMLNPVANLRISCRDKTTTSGAIVSDAGLGNKTSVVTAIRIG